ncbi:MAG: NADH:ubiquinone reductase (Na(+)-transporting) subunit A [Planctomycetota bacterium]|nr:MAG: NADH:ubiquinone reductase (Na(+)-transporting) subunit A [Planctomycetota bacterium]
MPVHKMARGLNLPIAGAPEQVVSAAPQVERVAVMADDYPFMRPRMHIQVGDVVKRGQLLFEDRKSEGTRFCAPAAGTISAIHRGQRRALISVVIELSDSEKAGGGEGDQLEFESFSGQAPAALDADAVKALLVESGLWTALRQRPYGTVPSPTTAPAAIFVTAMDTNPLAGRAEVILKGREAAFENGLAGLSKLAPKLYLCKRPGAAIPAGAGAQVEEFEGPHPAGLPGTHIHFLEPVHMEKAVWHLDYQDVVAIGRLLQTGKVEPERIVALAGPVVKKPRLVRTRLGAALDTLVNGELEDGENRVVSGSVLCGRKAMGDEHGYLGRYDSIVSCLAEDRERVFFGWLKPGGDKHSTVRAFLSALSPGRLFKMTTTTNGSHRAMVPIGMFERVMPLDIMPTFLLRALLVSDLEQAEKLGALELIEEDLALCSYVSPGKEDYGVALRKNLLTLWKEG